MKRILFVDDEPRVLDGLQRMLRGMRGEWDMTFVTSGALAIAALEQQSRDVVVSDMRMPVMDGATLLATVYQRWPDTIRVILSGHSDQHMAMRAVAVAHQFLSKPTDPATLKDVVERATALRDSLNNQSLRQIVGSIDSLPSLPRVYQQLMSIVDRPEATAQDIARIVEQDPALAGSLLKVVNSAFFGLPRGVSNIAGAIAYLGVTMVKSLTMSVELFRPASGPQVKGISIDQVQAHAVLTARIAARLLHTPDERDHALIAGLLHDVGNLVLLRSNPELLANVRQQACAEQVPPVNVEQRLWGASHAELGAYLLGIWGLPCAIVKAVAHHHQPLRAQGTKFDLVGAIHVAGVLAQQVLVEPREGEVPQDQIDVEYLQSVGVAEELPAWQQMAASMLPREKVS